MDIRIIHPETVNFYQIHLQQFSLPSLQSQINSLTGLEPQSQILVSNQGYSLKKTTQPPSSPIFLFSKNLALKKFLPLDFATKPIKNQLQEPCPGEEKGFLILERRLRRIAQKALSLKNYAQSWLNYKDTTANEIQIFSQSLNLLQKYYSNYHQKQIDSFNNLQSQFEKYTQNLQQELIQFEPALKALQKINLHSALIKQNRSVLAQVLNIEKFNKWKQKLLVQKKQFQQKLQSVKTGISGVSSQIVSQNFQQFSLPPIALLKQTLQPLQEIIQVYTRYRQLCYQCLYQANQSAADEIQQLDWSSQAENCSTLVQLLQKEIQNSENQTKILVETRKQSGAVFLANVKKITDQSFKNSKTLKSQISMLFTLFKKLQNKLEILKVPKMLPEAYEASLIQITRRRKFVQKAIQLQNIVNQVAEEQIKARMEFLDKYKHILPSSLLPELAAYPCIRPVYFKNQGDLKLPVLQDIQESVLLFNSQAEINSLKEKIQSLQSINEIYQINLKQQQKIIENTSLALDEISLHVKGLQRELSQKNLKLQAQNDKIQLMRVLESKFKQLEEELQSWISVLPPNINSPNQLQDTLSSLATIKYEMISFTSFEIGTLALFFPTDDGNFQAFNHDCINNILDLDSLPQQTLQNLEYQPFIIGRITDKKVVRSSTVLTINEDFF